jgi:hypothetical protein
VYGLYLLILTLYRFVVGFDYAPDPEIPYHIEAFFLRTGLNLLFLAAIIFAGIKLLLAREKGVQLSNKLFVLMILYFLEPFSRLLGPEFGISMGATAGTGNMGISPILLTGYPLIALIVLNVVRVKTHTVRAGVDPEGKPEVA